MLVGAMLVTLLHRAVFAFLPLMILVPAAAHAQDESVPRLTPTECEFTTTDADAIDCFLLTVYEDRAEQGRTIDLPVAIIRARDPQPGASPLVYSAGGPGSTSLSPVSYFRDSTLSEARDVILFEQRGAPFAEPPLECPEIDRAAIDSLIRDDSAEAEAATWADAARACYERLAAEGVNPDAYTTRENAADFYDFWQVSDYDALTLYGVSYSTLLFLTVAQETPEIVTALVLDSVLPPDVSYFDTMVAHFDRAWSQLVADCAADAACADAYPDLPGLLESAVTQMNTTPVVVEVIDPITDQSIRLTVDGYDLASGVFDALYNPSTVELLPFLLDQITQGNVDVLLPLAQAGADGLLSGEWGLFYGVFCSEKFPLVDPTDLAADRDSLAFLPGWSPLTAAQSMTVCESGWMVPPADSTTFTPVEADIPALILAGNYDPITPPAWGEQAAATLPNATVVTFPYESHVLSFEDACARSLVEAFVNDPAAPLDDCSGDDAALDFLLPDEITATAGFYRLDSGVIQGRSSGEITLLAVVGVAMLLHTGLLLTRLRRMKRAASQQLRTLSWLVLALVIAFVVAVVVIVSTTPSLTLAFGVPSAYSVFLWLPVLIGLAALLLAGRTVIALAGSQVSYGLGFYYGFFSLVMLVFVAWVRAIGLSAL